MREGSLEREGVALHYLEWPGDDGPPVLALHGLSSNARFWSRVATRVAGRRFVALDQRSHGRSAPSRPGDGIATFVDDVAHVISLLSLERPVLAGHSWGAAIALEVAARLPDRVGALAFVDGPAWPLSDAMPWEAFAARAQPPLPRYRDLEDAIAASRGSLGAAWGDDLIEFVHAGLIRDGDAFVLPLTHEARGRILRDLFELRQDLAWRSLSVPAFAAFASRKSDLMLEATRRSAGRIASVAARVAIKWYDTPHDIPLYAPDAIASDIREL